MVETHLLIYKSPSVASGSSDTVIDVEQLKNKKILSIKIVVNNVGWSLDLLNSFRSHISIMEGSQTSIVIDDTWSIEPKGDAYFIFRSPTEWKLTNNGAGASTYEMYIDIIKDV